MNINIYPVENATALIQSAIDRASESGGGRVILNDGEYQLKSILLRSEVTLYLTSGVRVYGSRDPEDYDLSDILRPEGAGDYTGEGKCAIEYLGRSWVKPSRSTDPYSRWSRAMIKAYRAKNIAVIGEPGATFDGCNCYDEQGEEGFRGPHFINFHECDGITLRGYTLKNSSNWGNALFTSTNVLCEKLTVLAGHDGIDFLSCDNVTIRDCTLKTGDDCVAGFDCDNVLIENCLFSTACNAMRIGGQVTVRGCRIVGSGEYGHRVTMTDEEKRKGAIAHGENARTNMLSAFEYYCDFRYGIRHPSDIVIENCEIEDCDSIISYCYTLPTHMWCKNKPLNSVTLRGTKAKNTGIVYKLYAPDEHPLFVTLENCELEVSGNELGVADNSRISFNETIIRQGEKK